MQIKINPANAFKIQYYPERRIRNEIASLILSQRRLGELFLHYSSDIVALAYAINILFIHKNDKDRYPEVYTAIYDVADFLYDTTFLLEDRYDIIAYPTNDIVLLESVSRYLMLSEVKDFTRHKLSRRNNLSLRDTIQIKKHHKLALKLTADAKPGKPIFLYKWYHINDIALELTARYQSKKMGRNVCSKLQLLGYTKGTG